MLQPVIMGDQLDPDPHAIFKSNISRGKADTVLRF